MTNAFRPSTAAALAIVTMTSLIPYNLFMNAHEYFYYKLRSTNETGLSIPDGDLFEIVSGHGNHSKIATEPTTELQRTYEGWFTVTSGITCILGALGNTVATNRLSNSFRVLVGHAIVLLSLVPTLLFTFIDTDQDQVHFFWATMLFSSISSFASSGLIGAGIQGLAAAYSASYVRVVMIASAVAGMGTSLLSIVCQAATDNAVLNGRIYFGIAFVWTIISIFCYLYLVNSSQEKESVEMDSDPIVDDNDDEDEEDSVDSSENAHRHDASANSQDSSSLFGGWGTIMKQSGADMACTMFIILVSCSAFPALASQVRPHTANAKWRAYFSSICCFLLYGFADGMGRIFAMRISISRRTLQNLSLARLLLLPLIAVCDVQPRHHSPTLIRNDAVFTSLIMALALSFGFCYTHAYVKAIQSVDPSLREKAGSLMSLASNVIALIGCLIGVGIVTLM